VSTVDKTHTDKQKNDLPDEKKRRVSPDSKTEKDTTLAKRSGQRPALPFRRKPPA
jgi:hypothetical protein